MTMSLIWLLAALAYGLFYAWYVGFRPRLTHAEVDDICSRLRGYEPARVAALRALLVSDDGREFYMANLLKVRARTESGESGKQMLERYRKPFLRAVLRRACHPIAIGFAFAPAVECWGLDNAEHWNFAGFVRYRSRRDLAETLVLPSFDEIHPFKVAALEKTIALPCAPAAIIGGGPKLVVPLLLLVMALLATVLAT